jgi:ATP-binding cassette subfamily G (WHITE) protein 1
MAGLQNDAGKFLILNALVVLTSLSGFALGIFFASVFSSLPIALAVTPTILIPLMLFSGLFINQGAIPSYLDWIKYISPMKYGFEGMTKNEFKGLQIIGPDNSSVTGEEVINLLGLGTDHLSIALCILVKLEYR